MMLADARSGAASQPNPAGSPDIVVILLDDIGFADAATFGGVARTPAIDRLAGQGLRYNNFNVAGVCSPTRAAVQMDNDSGAYWGDFGIGRAYGSPVSEAFTPPFAWTGTLHEVRVELK
jgi:arylsulfatase